jgi:ribosomal protein L16 Arg81 hydroxylase
MSKTDELDHELKQMEAQMKGTVDINYEKYNNVFMDKIAEHNRELKSQKSEESNRKIEQEVQEGAIYLHNKSKDRKIYY